jgi:hypothetical protein
MEYETALKLTNARVAAAQCDEREGTTSNNAVRSLQCGVLNALLEARATVQSHRDNKTPVCDCVGKLWQR